MTFVLHASLLNAAEPKVSVKCYPNNLTRRIELEQALPVARFKGEEPVVLVRADMAKKTLTVRYATAE
jgi:hypothetical protein